MQGNEIQLVYSAYVSVLQVSHAKLKQTTSKKANSSK